jgi:lipid A 4'-phosphatase
MLIRPSIAFFLIFTFVVGPGLVVNGLVKAYWARPRPDFVQQFGGHEHFKPWWKPGGDCVRNCSFVSGEAAEMFWLLAPASVATAAIAPIALTAATVSAAGLSVLRFVFGRHFTIDVIFGAVLIVLIVQFAIAFSCACRMTSLSKKSNGLLSCCALRARGGGVDCPEMCTNSTRLRLRQHVHRRLRAL